VIYVLGNHEYYGKTYPKLVTKLKEISKGSNLHVLENEAVTIDGVNFLGCSLWTDFELFGDPKIAGYHCQQVMTDYKKIKRLPSYGKIRSLDVAMIHHKSKQWLQTELEKRQGQKNVVITHHGPSLKSVEPDYHKDMTTAAYVSHLDGFIEQYQPDFWLHGHLHNSSDYQIGNTRVLCNPKGYPGEENEAYNPEFVFEI